MYLSQFDQAARTFASISSKYAVNWPLGSSNVTERFVVLIISDAAAAVAVVSAEFAVVSAVAAAVAAVAAVAAAAAAAVAAVAIQRFLQVQATQRKAAKTQLDIHC